MGHAARATHERSYRYNEAIEVAHYRLDNGLHIIVQADDSPVFSYQTWLRVGSRHEVEGKTGIAHLFEHLMFKGTPRFPEGEYDRRLEALGARVNAATWLDWTWYYQDAPNGAFADVVELEADRLEHLRLDSGQLEAERKVVINERKERVDNDPGAWLGEKLWRSAYSTHPYGRPTIGWMPDIEGLSLADCQAFYRTWYAPNNALVVVSGGVDADAAVAQIAAAYGHLEAQALPPVDLTAEPVQTAARREVHALSMRADRLLVAYHAPCATAPLTPALEVLTEVLFEGDSARLMRDMVTDGELATGIFGFCPALREAGLFEVSVDLRRGVPAEAAEAVLTEALATVCAHGITPAELDRAKNKLETRFYRQLQTTQARAQGLGYWSVTGDDDQHLFTVADAYRAVDLAAVIEAAQVFRPENSTTVIGRAE